MNRIFFTRIAVLIVSAWTFAIALWIAPGHSLAYRPEPGLPPLPVITPDNAAQVTELLRIGRGTITRAAWSPDGKMLAAAGALGVWLYDADHLDAAPHLLEGHSERVLAVAFSPDGTLLATGSADGTARLWDVTTGASRFVLAGHQTWVWGIVFSPDGKTLATGGDYGFVRQWDVKTGAELAPLENYCDPYPGALAYSPDGKFIACAAQPGNFADYADGGLWLRNFGVGSPTVTRLGPTYGAAFSPDGKWLAASREVYPPDSSQQVILWNVESGTVAREIMDADPGVSFASRMVEVTFNASSKLLAAAGYGGLRLWDMATNAELDRLLPGQQVDSAAFHPTDPDRIAYVSENVLYVRDLKTGDEQRVVHDHPVTAVAFSPDGALLASARDDGLIQLWDAATGTEQAAIQQADGGPVYQLAFSPDGKWLAAGTAAQDSGRQGSIRVWDVQTKQPAALIPTQISPSDFPPGFVFDGTGILYTCPELPPGETEPPAVSRWDITTSARQTFMPVTSSHCLRQLALNPDKRQLVTLDNGAVTVWDTTTQQQAVGWTNQPEDIQSFALSSNGILLAFNGYISMLGGGASSLSLCLAQPGAEPVELINADNPLVVVFFAAAFSPDNHLLASAGSTDFLGTNAGIWLWDVQTHARLSILKGHQNTMTSVAFNPSGTLIASGSQDGTIRLWGVRKN